MIIFNTNRLIPAPFVSWRKENNTTQGGEIVGPTYGITLQGILVADAGSPNSTGNFHQSLSTYPDNETVATDAKFGSLLRKQESLRTLFSSQNDGKLLRIYPPDLSTPQECNPRIKSISFERQGNDPLVNQMGYTINLEADKLTNPFGIEESADVELYKVSSSSEDWNLEVESENLVTYRLSRRISAVGKRFYSSSGTLDIPPWKNARSYVLGKIGLGLKDEMRIASGVLNLNAYDAYNYQRAQSVNEGAGEFSVTENWIVFGSGQIPATNEYSVDTRVSADNGFATVSINGQIQGLSLFNNTTQVMATGKYDNALAKFNQIEPTIYSLAQTISTVSLHPYPVNRVIGRNTINGTISYNYEYNNRPTGLFPGSISETYTESFDNPGDIFASLNVFGRAVGPILQDMETTTGKGKSVSMELVFSGMNYGGSIPTKPTTTSLVNYFAPTGVIVVKQRDQENWSFLTGRYSRNVSWVYE